MTVDELLARARARLRRLHPHEAIDAIGRGAVLVDIRADSQRQRDGLIPDAVVIPRNVLEWRCDPCSPAREARVCECDGPLILVCDEGYQSSLAAASLQELGRRDATDLVGGFQAWRAQGLPVESASRTGRDPLGRAPLSRRAGRSRRRPGRRCEARA